VNDTAQTLVEQLVAAEGWPEPQLLEDILEQGETAVPSLLEIVRREVIDWSEAETLCQACLLLGSLGATSAIPDLVELFYRYDSDLLEDVYRALAMLGAEAVEPALAVVRDGSLGWYPRAMAIDAAIEASSQEPALQARVTATLRELLADYITRAETLDDEEIDMATSLVTDLALLADPEARALIDAAFEADIVDQWVIEPRNVADDYRQGGKQPAPPNPDAWLRRYRNQYREHLDWESRQQREAQKPKRRGIPARRREGPKLGRNDPCWCGSGKKYKHCHLRQDQGG
jgi:hypothetical protein